MYLNKPSYNNIYYVIYHVAVGINSIFLYLRLV